RLFPTTVRLRTVPTIAFAAVIWTGIVYFSSTNRAISAESFVWVLCAAIFASSVDWLGHHKGPLTMAWILVPASINAVIFLLQRFHIWQPIAFDVTTPEHFQYTALIGNPAD